MATRKAAAKPPARKPGRPSKFSDEMCRQAEKLCLLGATNDDLADFFGVAVSTVSKWLKEIPEFSEALKRGRVIADAEVARSLYQRAIGYSHPDVHVSNFQGAITITPLTKHYPPDTAAAFIWLQNRRSKDWRRTPESGGDEDPAPPQKVIIEVQDGRRAAAEPDGTAG
jgi:hypothetical protein